MNRRHQKICIVLYEKTFFTFVYTVCNKNIQITLIVNINQTGMVFVSKANDAIYEIKRAKQVFIYGKDKKRVFIAVLLDFYEDKVLFVLNI